MSNSPLTIIAITTAQEKLVGETLLEDGCLRYELHQSLDDGRVRIFVETWESEAQWRAHMEGAAMQRFQASGVGDYFADFALHRLLKVAG